MNLAERLRRAMEQAGLDQRELYRRTRVSESTISKIITGSTLNPSAVVIEKLAKGIGVPVSVLLGERPVEEIPEDELLARQLARQIPRDKWYDFAEYVEGWLNLTTEGQETVAAIQRILLPKFGRSHGPARIVLPSHRKRTSGNRRAGKDNGTAPNNDEREEV